MVFYSVKCENPNNSPVNCDPGPLYRTCRSTSPSSPLNIPPNTESIHNMFVYAVNGELLTDIFAYCCLFSAFIQARPGGLVEESRI